MRDRHFVTPSHATCLAAVAQGRDVALHRFVLKWAPTDPESRGLWESELEATVEWVMTMSVHAHMSEIETMGHTISTLRARLRSAGVSE